jgi:sporulation protein YlmC with PRC-barrel domain
MRDQDTMNRLEELRGAPVIGSDGDKFGTVEHIYLDVESNEPKWFAVKTGMLGGRAAFVPLQGADIEGNTIRVLFTKEQVESSPDVVPDAVSRFSEQELLNHYGLTQGGYEQPATVPAGQQAGYKEQPVREPLATRLRRWEWEARSR